MPSGQRKKVSGATTYKRPGPPTPSKKAGRLSFGSEILKESNENILIGAEACSNYKKSTPGKLKALFNSSSKVKDEVMYIYFINLTKFFLLCICNRFVFYIFVLMI